MKSRFVWQSALAGTLILGGSAAQAQDGAASVGTTTKSQSSTSASARGADGAQGASEEIIVTAQRREQRLEDVPASISALSGELLAKSGINNMTEIAKLVPGVQMTFYGNFLQPSVRGVTSTGANVGENSNVAMYIDGVYQPQQIATLIDLPDIQQIEVLKGPQGALYGQNATGGAILVTSMAPSFETQGKLSASYGSYDDRNLRGYATGPITDSIAASISGGYQKRDGFRNNILTGENDDGLDSKIVRGKVLFRPSDSADITLTAFYSDRRDTAANAGFPINNNSVGFAFDRTAPKVNSPDDFSTREDVFTEIKSTGGSILGKFDVGAGTINSTTGVTSNRIEYLTDVDYTTFEYVIATTDPLKGDYFEQELNFASGDFGPVSFLVGGLYINGSEEFVHNRATLAVFPAFSTDQNARVEKEIFAGYAELTFQATDKLVLTAGGRYTSEEQRTFSDLVNTGAGQQKRPNKIEYPDDPVDFSKFTPRITARYELTPDSNVYVSWGEGFKSGVVNTTNYTIPPVEPEEITAYEVGYKGRPLDQVRFNIAAFLYDYDNLQAVAYQPGGSGYITQNAATARIKGVDFDLSWTITPDFTLSGSAAFLPEAEYRSFPDAVSFVPNGFGHTATKVDLSGSQLLRAPESSGTIAASYQHDTDVGAFGAYVSVYHTSSMGMEVTDRIKQRGYTTVDGELSFEPATMANLRVVLWGKNLTDEAYLSTVLVAGLVADGGIYAEPRTYGLKAEYSF